MFLKILLTAYCGAALFAAGVTAAGRLVSFPFLGFLSFLLALGLIPAIAFETARRPTRPRLIQAGIVVVLGAGALLLSPKLIPASRRLYFRQRRADFQQLADITLRAPSVGFGTQVTLGQASTVALFLWSTHYLRLLVS